MKRIGLLLILLLSFFQFTLFSAKDDIHFNRGIAFLLIDEMPIAARHFNAFFQRKPNPTIKKGFDLLLDGNPKDATYQFKSFLEINHRSTYALVGIALSTSHEKVSNTKELLERAIRLDRRFSSAYYCLGNEYLKRKNYPGAERNFRLALRYSNIPEYKILLGRLYLILNKPEQIINELLKEADQNSDNFYANLLVAKAQLQLNQLDKMGKYVQAALEVNPRSNDARLLTAKFHLGMNDPQKAKVILKDLKFEGYNEDYIKTNAKVLVKAKDKNAKKYLYEVFSRNQWDQEINKFLGLYHLWISKKGNIQNWIYRAIISGVNVDEMKELFPEKYTFPEYKSFPFFDLKRIKWISEDVVLVSAIKNSGDKDNLYFIDINKMKVMKTITFRGTLQDMFITKDRKNIIFTTVAKFNESVYLYGIEITEKNIKFTQVYSRPINIASIFVGFNSTGTIAYITDKKIDDIAFESPFSKVTQYGKKTPVYPVYPVYIYKYNFISKRFSRIRDMSQLESIPIKSIKKYLLVFNAMQSHSKIESLIRRGQKFDLTSAAIVRIYFSDDLSSFVIYLSDSKSSFKGHIFDGFRNRVIPIDAGMFLGKQTFSQVQLLHLNPLKNEIILMPKDEKKELIIFNYKSRLFVNVAANIFKYLHQKENDTAYIITGRSDRKYYSDTRLQIVTFNPFFAQKINSATNLVNFLPIKHKSDIYFSTYDGEVVRMDDEYFFAYVKPSLDGSIYAGSPFSDKTVAFINGRLLIF